MQALQIIKEPITEDDQEFSLLRTVSNGIDDSPVASNYSNLLTTAIFPVLWHYGVPHSEVNAAE